MQPSNQQPPRHKPRGACLEAWSNHCYLCYKAAEPGPSSPAATAGCTLAMEFCPQQEEHDACFRNRYNTSAQQPELLRLELETLAGANKVRVRLPKALHLILCRPIYIPCRTSNYMATQSSPISGPCLKLASYTIQHTCLAMQRSNHGEHTRSHQNSEVKRR